MNKLFLITGLLSLVSASFSSGFDEINKHPDSIVYVNLADEAKSYWASHDREINSFTAQFLGTDPKKGTFMPPEDKDLNFFSLYSKAESIQLEETSIDILRDSVHNGQRTITMKLQIHRAVNKLTVKPKAKLRLKSLTVNGQKALPKNNSPFILDSDYNRILFRYIFTQPNEIVEFSYTIPKEDDPSLVLIEISPGLMENPNIQAIRPDLKPRSENRMEKYINFNDAILVKREISF